MITITTTGDWNKTESFLRSSFSTDIRRVLNESGKAGVIALAAATPVDSGTTASDWDYRIDVARGGVTLQWTNKNLDSAGTPIAILLQYGHGTGTGGYVAGRDYINPAIKPVFDRIADSVWKAVKSR